jgi:NADH-quinone oxidoreductase subunit N
MSPSSIIALLPLIILAAGAVVTMLGIAFWRSHALTVGFTLVIFLLAFLSIPLAASRGTVQVTSLLIFDGFAYFIIGLVIAACFVVTLLAYGYLRIHQEKPEEFYLLLLSAALGSSVLAASSHFVSFFLGLEILSISLYAMLGYAYNNPLSIEAGVKYLILAASSAAFLLFGMALIYAELGTMEFARVAADLASLASNENSVYLMAGFVLIMVGIGYKLALVPFHMWTPDVYEGAPAPVAAFVATVSKGSVFAVLLRFYLQLNVAGYAPLLDIFVGIAIATMLIGNLLALRQTNLKRLLAYSSIANLGYLLVAFLAGGANAVVASSFYLTSYFITTLAAFGVVTVLSTGSQDASQLEDYRGLMWRRPWLAAILTVAMFSLAGIPFTIGFIGKFYLVFVGVDSALWLLVLILVVSSAIGLYYYLRVVVILFASIPGKRIVAEQAPSLSPLGSIALAGLFFLLMGLGIYPGPLIHLIQIVASFTH